jgi:L-ascorbate metabolism protein UlaG (beta-lactamase superfamily)
MLAGCILSAGMYTASAGPVKRLPASHQLISRELEPSQAIVWYLYHSGWAVKTQNHLLIFDYTEPSERPAKRSLDSGSIDPAEISGQNVTVFVSHGHTDHFDPLILEWRAAIKSIRYIWGWEGVGSPEDVHFGRERRTVEADDLEIMNIHHNFDGIPESAFLVQADGLTLLHAGDHGHSRGLENPAFKDNILYLTGKAPRLDLFFTPSFGGEIEAIQALKPQVVFPMHDGGNERQYAKFARKVKALGLDVEVGVAERAGARFLYAKGTLVPDEKTCVRTGAPQLTRQAKMRKDKKTNEE